MKVSWVILIFQALLIDYRTWKSISITCRNFENQNIELVGVTIINRWKGVNATYRNTLVPFKNDVWTVVMLFDPYYVNQNMFNPEAFDRELEINCMQSTRNILRKFCPSKSAAASEIEQVFNLVTMEGNWGAEANIRQEDMNQCIPDRQTFKSEIEKVIWKLNIMMPTKNLWRAISKSQCNYISEIGIRLAVLSVQSANLMVLCTSSHATG